MHPATVEQFAQLKERFPEAQMDPLPSGAALVTIPAFPIPPGWSQSSTTVRFIVPVGYPGPRLDCFWAESGLRLTNGNPPQSSNDPYFIPETTQSGLWFSWHTENNAWNPAKNTLSTWAGMITNRFNKPQ
ncbi:E2/UBC family protein [Roseateles sp. P5_E1]